MGPFPFAFSAMSLFALASVGRGDQPGVFGRVKAQDELRA